MGWHGWLGWGPLLCSQTSRLPRTNGLARNVLLTETEEAQMAVQVRRHFQASAKISLAQACGRIGNTLPLRVEVTYKRARTDVSCSNWGASESRNRGSVMLAPLQERKFHPLPQRPQCWLLDAKKFCPNPVRPGAWQLTLNETQQCGDGSLAIASPCIVDTSSSSSDSAARQHRRSRHTPCLRAG